MIINLTQHEATAEQLSAGVVDLGPERLAALVQLLTIDVLPGEDEVVERARQIAAFVPNGEIAMIGGAPWLMAPLERALRARGVTPFYAFSRRESVEERSADGLVRKTAVFRHVGFVAAVEPVGFHCETCANSLGEMCGART